MHMDPDSSVNKYAFAVVHWLLSLLLAPVAIIGYDAIKASHVMNDVVGMYLLFVLYGGVFSLPTLILYLVAYNYLVKFRWSHAFVKIGLNTVAVLGIVITFQILGGSISTLASACYAGSVVLVSLFIRIDDRSPVA